MDLQLAASAQNGYCFLITVRFSVKLKKNVITLSLIIIFSDRIGFKISESNRTKSQNLDEVTELVRSRIAILRRRFGMESKLNDFQDLWYGVQISPFAKTP